MLSLRESQSIEGGVRIFSQRYQMLMPKNISRCFILRGELGLSARAYDRVFLVSRMIADLERGDAIALDYVS